MMSPGSLPTVLASGLVWSTAELTWASRCATSTEAATYSWPLLDVSLTCWNVEKYLLNFASKSNNGILFILNAVGKSEKSFPNEKEK